MHPLILAAIIGGGTGGLSAAARGTDVGKGILTGAASGAITSGLGSMLSAGQSAAAAQSAANALNPATEAGVKAAEEAARLRAIETARINALGKNPNLKQALDPFALAGKDKIGRMAYATTPSAAMMGEFLFNPEEKPKKKGPPLNMLYGRHPDRFMFGQILLK